MYYFGILPQVCSSAFLPCLVPGGGGGGALTTPLRVRACFVPGGGVEQAAGLAPPLPLPS